MASKAVRVTQKSPIKPSPEGGETIGWVWAGAVLVVEISSESPHDGWYHIVNPNPPINVDGTYLKTGRPGWIEAAHCEDTDKQLSKIIITIDWENQSWEAKEL